MNTNWSSPKLNIFAALWCLRGALNSGHNARLIKMRNEDCDHPIRVKKVDMDFRNYEFNYGIPKTRNLIIEDQNMSDFQKHLTLNYKTCYGTEEAVKAYYESGKLSMDNFKGIGYSHLVNVDDIIMFFKTHPDPEQQKRADALYERYRDPEKSHYSYFFDMFNYKHGSEYSIKKFKHKLWVVQLLDSKPAKIPAAIKILNVIAYPLKFIPKKSVLKMEDYTNYSFTIGDVINGFKIEFRIPKKFSF